MTSTLERARGRWREILPQLGIDTRYLTNKKGPCPICCPNVASAKCFRFDDREGTGSFYCTHCGPGGGLLFVARFHKKDFSYAYKEVERIIGEEGPKYGPKTDKPNTSIRLRNILQLLESANEPLLVDKYLVGRGIYETSSILKGHPSLPYYDEDGNFIGNFPAIIAPIQGPDGSIQSAQRIYIGDLDQRKKTMPPVETINGASVRLFVRAEEMGVAEGIETALAAAEMFRMPVWAALSAHGVEVFQPPLGIKKLHIFGDNDRSFTGQRAAFTLANNLYTHSRDLEVEVHIPETVETDYNDVLRERLHAKW